MKQLDDALATLSMDLVALQEIRWLGNGVHNRRGKHCYDIYYSYHDRHRVLGTGFAVGPRLEPAIMDFKAINDRLCTLRMRGKFFNISLINVHAPTEDKEEEEKDLFYGRLARTIDACPRHDLKIILGDFNAKVGREPMYRQYNTHPDGESFNQTDHVLISRRRQSSLLNVRTYRGANIDFDYYLVGLVIRCRIARPCDNGGGENTQPRLNTDSLRDITVQQEFKAALDESLLPENSYETTSERWNALKTKIINCARNILYMRYRAVVNGFDGRLF